MIPSPAAVRELDIDIANTARSNAYRAAQQPMVSDEDRTLELQLRNSVRIVAGRVRAGLPPRAHPDAVGVWHAWLKYRFWLAKYGRRHPHHPINRALGAH